MSASETEGIKQTFSPHELRSFLMENFNLHTHVEMYDSYLFYSILT